MDWMLPPGHMLRQHPTFVCLFVCTGVCVCVRVFRYACEDPRGTPLASFSRAVCLYFETGSLTGLKLDK